MSDEEKLISDAFQQAFKKTARIPTDLYVKMHHELMIDDNVPLKVNLTIKRGLVLDIDDDSLFRTFLNVGDIVLTINDLVASRPDFKLMEAFKDKKTITFAYIRLRNYAPEEPHFEDGDRRDAFDYKIAVIYCLQRMKLGMVMEGLNNRVYITKLTPKSLGSMCAAVGDVILQVNGKRVCDTEKAMEIIVSELESKSHFKITLERAKTEEARALVQYAITKEHRDPPVPGDCADYVDKALGALKGTDPRSIMKTRVGATDDTSRVAFHDRITTEAVIPSDVADEALIKTPARVPNSPGQQQQQQQQPTSTAPSSEAIDKGEASVTKVVSTHEPDKKATPFKSTNRRHKGSSKKTADSGKSKESGLSTMSVMGASSTASTLSASPSKASFKEWRKKLSTEIFFGRARKKSAPTAGGTLEAAKNKKKKNKKENNTNNTADTEGGNP